MTTEENGIEFEQITPEIYKFENPEDSITGVLLEKLSNIGANESNMYALETKEGFQKIWGSTVLDNLMAYVKVGDIVRITFQGKEKNAKNQDVNVFTVEKGKKKETTPTEKGKKSAESQVMSPGEVEKAAVKFDPEDDGAVEPTEEEKVL